MGCRKRLRALIRSERERGAVLVLFAGMLVVLMGMGAMAVDYGWLYFNQLNALKAAESAALAGVARMPLPNCADPVSGTVPYDTSIEIATSNGYSTANGDTVSPVMGSTCARLQVTVSRTIPTFFMRVFGIDTLKVTESATAEHLPNLKLGSDDSFLGDDPTIPARNVNFYLAVNGDRTNKAQGDSYTSECYGDFDTSCQGPNFEFNQELPDGNPSYYYAIDVPAGYIGDALVVELFDPQASPGGVADDRNLSYPDTPVVSDPYEESRLRFRLLEPDDTPNSWTDNTEVVCTQTYYHEDHASYVASDKDSWVPFCADIAIQGVYVLEVRQTGNVDLLNAFSIRAVVNGNLDNGVAVYGLGAMSLWNSQAGAGTQFKVVRLDDVYAGSRLVIQLWDVGDITGTGSLEFKGSLAPYECEIRERDEAGVVTSNPAWGADDGNQLDGSVGCFENISPEREYNNEWLDFAFEIPSSFTCTGDDCWATVQYNLPGTPHDRTTWSAFIDGQPIHLIP